MSSEEARSSVCVEDHVMTEKKRREKLNQQFVELLGLIPGLKKIDKASLIGDAINYIRELEEKLKTLEDKKRASSNSVKSWNSRPSPNENLTENSSSKSLPEIEVKMVGKNVLVKLHCLAGKGVLAKMLAEIEELHLVLRGVSSMPFTSSSLCVTVTAQFEEGYYMTVNELLKRLSTAFIYFLYED
ncbi:hypothetical protein J5N97_028444 [Dioscorea zingiberensis]|uniref:BHLH domain-containing protein n=1 Tax=Dioscorea zingiberensis TaxID=325984 RepID=A0A9D5BYG7_9LILI|nr:hypothetical protein J5N97_028444 [Dioscorea zingiberensis]